MDSRITIPVNKCCFCKEDILGLDKNELCMKCTYTSDLIETFLEFPLDVNYVNQLLFALNGYQV